MSTAVQNPKNSLTMSENQAFVNEIENNYGTQDSQDRLSIPSTYQVFDEAYARLNEDQKKAVDTLSGPLVIMAGPGSGKTQVLSLRIANILKNLDIEPENILCLTYTEAGASNMQKRLIQLIGPKGARVNISTFHGFCKEQIDTYSERFFDGQNFVAIDEVENAEILLKSIEKLAATNTLKKKVDGVYMYLQPVSSKISLLKREGLSVEDYHDILHQIHNFLQKYNSKFGKVMDINLRSKDNKMLAIKKFTKLYEQLKTDFS